MIDAKELRIGNYILLRNKLVMVGGIPNVYKLLIPGEQYAVEVEEFGPIPITEKLLLKCGFKYVGAEINGEIVQQFFLSDLKNICFGRNNNGIYLCTLYNNGYAEIDRLSIIKRVTYLHQLQNLYFDLTGKELEVTL